MTTRRNSSRGFGTMDSDESRRSGRGSRKSQGRSQNRDEYESDYEDYSDEDDDEDQGNRYMSSGRNNMTGMRMIIMIIISREGVDETGIQE